MKKLFIFGSRFCSNYDYDALGKSLQDKKILVLVGDCYGVDTNIQKMCIKYGIDFKVYYIGKGRTVLSSNKEQVKGYRYVDKDIKMCNDCTLGLAIWNGSSLGTKNNITLLNKLNKKVYVVNMKGEN